jgi:hypothetical protein
MRQRYVWLSLGVSSLLFNACYDTSGNNDGDDGDGGELGGGTAGRGGSGGKGGSSGGKGGTSGSGGTITPGAGGSTGGSAGSISAGGTSGASGSGGTAGSAGTPAGNGGGGAGGTDAGAGGASEGGAPPDPEGGSPGTGGTGDAGGAPNSAGGASGMGGSAGAGPVTATCAALASKLSSCELFDGEVLGDCWDYNPTHQCAAGCAVAASCADISDYYCNSAVNEVSDCFYACSSIVTFECNDGSVQPIGYVCDEYPDCPSGEDEVGCLASCDNGEQIPAEWVCDLGEPDCTDGSDEAGCGELTCPVPPTPEP